MSRKIAPKPKPKPRGRQGGRKPRYLLPGEDVCMQDIKLRLRGDIVEVLTQRATAAGTSRDEYVMQLLCPEIMQRLQDYRQAARQEVGDEP